MCKYLIDWPTGATYKDQLIFDANIIDRTTLYLTTATSYTDPKAITWNPGKLSRNYIEYPNKLYVTYVANEIFYGEFNFWLYFGK